MQIDHNLTQRYDAQEGLILNIAQQKLVDIAESARIKRTHGMDVSKELHDGRMLHAIIITMQNVHYRLDRHALRAFAAAVNCLGGCRAYNHMTLDLTFLDQNPTHPVLISAKYVYYHNDKINLPNPTVWDYLDWIIDQIINLMDRVSRIEEFLANLDTSGWLCMDPEPNGTDVFRLSYPWNGTFKMVIRHRIPQGVEYRINNINYQPLPLDTEVEFNAYDILFFRTSNVLNEAVFTLKVDREGQGNFIPAK